MVSNLIKFISEHINKGERVALLTLVDKDKGAPGAPGQMMAVLASGKTVGTIGGGTTEHELTLRAIDAIKNNVRTFEFDYDLSKKGMICGGAIRGFCNVLGLGNRLVIFGGGHIAQALYPLAKSSGFSVVIVEDREEFKENFPSATYLPYKAGELNEHIVFDSSTYIVICTRGHSFDHEALKLCIDKEYAYLGMIGSSSKVSSIFEKIQDNDGVSEELLKKVYSPIGLNIADGTPPEIAISIIAEILLVKNSGTLRHMKKYQ